jgi:hypothetical protein
LQAIQRVLTTIGAGLTLLIAIGIVVLGRPDSGPTPFPSDRPIARASPSATPPQASTSARPPATDEPIVLSALEPDEPPVQLAGECLGHMTIIDYAFEPTVPFLTHQAASVILGRVGAVGSGRWNSSNGAPPQDLDDQAMPVIRLVRIDVDRTVTGPPVPATIVVWVPGGTIGCQMWSQTGDPGPLAPGDRFALFVGWRRPAIRLNDLRSANAWLRIDAAGQIQADERELTVDAFIELVEHGR